MKTPIRQLLCTSLSRDCIVSLTRVTVDVVKMIRFLARACSLCSWSLSPPFPKISRQQIGTTEPEEAAEEGRSVLAEGRLRQHNSNGTAGVGGTVGCRRSARKTAAEQWRVEDYSATAFINAGCTIHVSWTSRICIHLRNLLLEILV